MISNSVRSAVTCRVSPVLLELGAVVPNRRDRSLCTVTPVWLDRSSGPIVAYRLLRCRFDAGAGDSPRPQVLCTVRPNATITPLVVAKVLNVY